MRKALKLWFARKITSLVRWAHATSFDPESKSAWTHRRAQRPLDEEPLWYQDWLVKLNSRYPESEWPTWYREYLLRRARRASPDSKTPGDEIPESEWSDEWRRFKRP